MRRRDAMGLIGAALGLSGCWGSDLKWRQKLTVVVRTPEGYKTGSSVTEVSMHRNTLFKDGAGRQYKIKGEAVVVDLGHGKYLFVLLSSNGKADAMAAMAELLAQKAVPLEGPGVEEAILAKIKSFSTPTPVPNDLLPLIVTFDDLNNPKSVREVKPEAMSKALGTGYSLVSATFELTEEALTRGEFSNLLPWLRSIWPNKLDGNRYWSAKATNQTANRISANSFSTEISK